MQYFTRAITSEQKRIIIEELLECWNELSHLRLGQLIINSITDTPVLNRLFEMEDIENRLFEMEDAELSNSVELFTREQKLYNLLK